MLWKFWETDAPEGYAQHPLLMDALQEFTEDGYGVHEDLAYRNHLNWVQEWSDMNPDAIRRLRTGMLNQVL